MRTGDVDHLARANYNLACAYALSRRFRDALVHLERAIQNPMYRRMALRDRDLAEARERRELQKLLE